MKKFPRFEIGLDALSFALSVALSSVYFVGGNPAAAIGWFCCAMWSLSALIGDVRGFYEAKA